MVFADVGRKLLKMITTRVGDLLVEHSDFLLLFFPVFTVRHHALEAPLHFGELVLGAAKGIDRKIDLAVREGGGLLHARIKANLPARFRMHGSFDFWSGCAGDYKRGLEILGIGVIDIDNHECMTLGSIQTPDCKTLDNMGKNLVDWYSNYLISRNDKLQSLSKTLVADAFFSKETFITPMRESDFHVISRFRNDVVLYYPTLEKKTGKRGHPKWFDGRIDFANPDLTRCKEYEVNKGKLYGLRVYAKALKRYVSLALWYPMDGRTDKWQLYFSTDDSMDGR